MKKVVIGLLALLVPAVAFAETPPQGVPLDVRRGFFTETDVGVFFTLGGDDAYSNAQTYVQLGVGYDITEQIELGVHFGLGASAANCFSGRNTREECTFADNFTVSFIDATAAYRFAVTPRFFVAPKLVGGYTTMDPAPIHDAADIPVTSAPNAGIGLGVEYATSMDHFTIGADVLTRMLLGPNILTIAIFPRVKYTF